MSYVRRQRLSWARIKLSNYYLFEFFSLIFNFLKNYLFWYMWLVRSHIPLGLLKDLLFTFQCTSSSCSTQELLYYTPLIYFCQHFFWIFFNFFISFFVNFSSREVLIYNSTFCCKLSTLFWNFFKFFYFSFLCYFYVYFSAFGQKKNQ